MSARAETLKNIPDPIIDITNYWQHYGLHHDPFATLGEKGGYYDLSRWEEHLDLMQYLCQYNNALVLVTGISGSGKTTLINQFTSHIENSMNVCQLTADNTLNTTQLIEITYKAFRLNYNRGDATEDLLDQHLMAIQSSTKICLLTIDDAHLLSMETFQSLLYLISQQTETQKRLHIILSGEPQLHLNFIRLAQAEGQTELLHPIILEPLDLDETERYLQYRLQNAGLEGEFPLSSIEVGRIYKLSEGVPGRINRIARRTLLNALARQNVDAAGGFLNLNKTKVYGGLLLLFIAGISIGILNWMVPDKPYMAKAMPMTKKMLSTKVQPKIHKEIVRAQPAPQSTPVPTPAIASNNTTTETLPSRPLPLIAESKSLSETQTFSATALLTPPTPSYSPLQPSTAPQSTPSVVTTPQNIALAKPIAKPSENKVSETQPKMVAAILPPLETNITPEKSEKIKPLPAAKPHKNKPSQSPLLSAKNKNHYTLQIIGLSSKEAMKKLITAQGISAKATFYETVLHGKNFYVLIYGQFKTPQEANAAVKMLPKSLQTQHPFPKKIGAILKESGVALTKVG